MTVRAEMRHDPPYADPSRAGYDAGLTGEAWLDADGFAVIYDKDVKAARRLRPG